MAAALTTLTSGLKIVTPQPLAEAGGQALTDNFQLLDAYIMGSGTGTYAYSTKLDDWATPDDNIDLNATVTYHGLLPKLSGNTSEFLTGSGTWATPTGTGLFNIVEDITPQLGGNLDLNNYNVTGTGSTITAATGTFESVVLNSNGYFSSQGDAKGFSQVIYDSVTHSDASWSTLYTDGSSGLITVDEDTVMMFSGKIAGSTQGCLKSAGFAVDGVVENDGGTVTLLSSNVVTLYDTDDTGFDVQASGNDINKSLDIRVQDTSATGDVVRWVGVLDIVSVTFPE